MKDDSSSEEEDFDAEVAFVIRNLRKFMKKKSNRKTYGDGKRRFKKEILLWMWLNRSLHSRLS